MFILLVPINGEITVNSVFLALFPNSLIFIGFIISLLILFASHLISFLIHFKESEDLDKNNGGEKVVERIFVFHFCLVLGLGVGAFFGGLPQGALVIFILVKTIFDLKLHLNYHK